MFGLDSFTIMMGIALTLLFGVILWELVFANKKVEEAIVEELTRQGYEIVELEVKAVAIPGGKLQTRGFFTVRRPGSPELFKGRGWLWRKPATIEWIADDPRDFVARHNAQAHGQTHASTHHRDIEAEVDARVEQILRSPAQAVTFDLDGSGHLDDQEMARLRARVRAEVEFDFDAERQRARQGEHVGRDTSKW